MRRSTYVAPMMFTLMMTAATAGAQTTAPPPPPAPPPAAPPAAPPPATPPPPASDTVVVAPPGSTVVVAPPAAAPATPPAPTVLDKISADAFVDAYGSLNYNFPKPQGPVAPLSNVGGNAFHALDFAQGFSVNWLGINASYAADPIGGTIGLRMGPGAIQYHAGTSDAVWGLQFVKQAYATWKPSSKLVLDFGKFDQPFGSEVGDSQLNMNYSRTLLWWYMQPLFFTGLRANIPVSDSFNILAFVANGWNNSIDNNTGKAFGAQVMLKPADSLMLYVGYVGSPEQADVTVTGAKVINNDVDGNWRHLVDLVIDFNPTKDLRFLFNANWRAEDNVVAGPMGHSAVAYGGNLVVRYNFTDAFYGSLRGDFFHDEHGDLLGTGTKTDAFDGTLTLAYGIGNHLALMLDNRLDVFDNPYFYQGSDTTNTTKTQFTTTLGVIASTK